MKRALGQLIWTQSRDIRVLNYPSHFVYEIWTNQGYLTLAHNKDTDKVEKLNGLFHASFNVSPQNSGTDKDTTQFVPTLK